MAVEKVAFEAGDEDEFVDELKPGTELMLGQYTIESFLNAGGFGITYLARDSLDRQVVIKECFPGSFCRRSVASVLPRSRAHQNELKSIVRLFSQEAKSLSLADHPNIVKVHQVFEENNTAYMALDFVEGRDLLDILADDPPTLTQEQVESYLIKLLDAVSHVHDQGILHRDISPDNILVNQHGEPVLIDFGAAREQAAGDKNASRVLSALRVIKDGYSPQEFYVQGSEQGPSCDLYSLAASFYHIITGELPPDSQVRLSAFAAGDPDPYTKLSDRDTTFSKEFCTALDKAMNILPKERIQSAGDWVDILNGKAVPEKAKTRPIAPGAAASGEKKSQMMPILLGTAAAAALGICLVYINASSNEGSAPVVSGVQITTNLDTNIDATVANVPTGPTTDMPTPDLALNTPNPADLAPAPSVSEVAIDISTALPLRATQAPPPRRIPEEIVAKQPDVTVIGPRAPIVPDAVTDPDTPLVETPDGSASPVIVTGTQIETNPSPSVDPEAPVIDTTPVEEPEVAVVEEPEVVVVEEPEVVVVEEPEVVVVEEPAAEIPSGPIQVSSSVNIPFTLDPNAPGVVASVTDVAPTWIEAGTKIVSVDGTAVATNDDIIALIEDKAKASPDNMARVSIGTEGRLAATAVEQPLLVGVQNRIDLKNGFSFVETPGPNGWITTVISAPEGEGLQPGDQLIAFATTGLRLNERGALQSLLERELGTGNTSFNFVVQRSGAMWVKAFDLAALAD